MDWRDVWRALAPRRMIGSDVREEIEFHIEERVRELVDQGWSERDARDRVLSRFGDVESVEEACRQYDEQRVNVETWRMRMEAWRRDVRLAWRSMVRNPGFGLVLVVTLALGIGATTAVFSVVEGVLLRPLPFERPEELAMVWQNDRATGTVRENASTSDYYDYVDRSQTFDQLAMHALGTAVLTRDGAPALQLNAASVTRNLSPLLGLDLQLGRPFTEAEDQPGGPRAVILTDRIWRELFVADREILGRSLNIDGEPTEIVGVLPPGIDYPAGQTDVWMPIRQAPTIATRPNHWVQVLGRLAPGVEVEAAQAEMSSIMAALEVEYPNDNVNRGAFVEPLAEVGRGDLSGTLWVLFGAVLAVLGIACVNVANLLLARGAGRGRELAVLGAIGAGRGQITRRFFAEGLVVTALAGALGVGLAALGVRVLIGLAPADIEVLGAPGINVPVLSFALGVSALICVGFGLLPTLQASRIDLQKELKEARTTHGGSAGLTVRRLLVAGQLCMAVVLLVGATLLIGTVRSLQSVDPGFRAENTLRVDFALPDNRYPGMATYPDWPEIHGVMEALERETAAIPGVASTAVVLNHPMDPGFTNSFRIEGQPFDPSQGEMTNRLVSPSYFETSGLQLVAGRLLDPSDRVGEPNVILLNREAASRYFPEGDAIGSRIAFWGPSFREIVGIVENERLHGLTSDVPPAMYISLRQAPPRGGKITLMARTDVPPLDVVEAVRETVASVDPEVPIFNVSTMEATVAEAISRERFASTVLSIFALVAVFLAVLGVHGVLAYLVAQRGHEVGIRMALGATRRDVVQMVLRQGVAMTGLGVLVGLALAFTLSGSLERLLFGVSATAPATYLGVGLALAIVAMAATALPARRAASIDPVESLRGE